mgnify:CR=1 FL=1
MGVVLKQSFWTSIIIYLGVLLGFLNSLILFPKFLETEEIGLLRQIISATTLLLPISAFGISATAIKFYPKFKDKLTSKNEFFSLQFILSFIGFTTIFLILLTFNREISNLFSKNSKILIDHFDIIIILLLILTISTIFESFLKVRMDIVLSNFVNGVLNRFLNGVCIVLLSLSLINFNEMIYLQIPIYASGVVLLIFYAYLKEPFKINFKIKNIKKDIKKIFNFSLYSIISGFGNIIILNIDILMVSALLGLSNTGIYTTAFYIGIIIEMPRRAISQISLPIISNHFKNNNLKKLNDYYKVVSINQLIIGSLIYLLVITNLENIYNLIPNKENFIKGIGVVSIIGIAKIVNMASGFGSEIIVMSKYYRFNVFTIIILAIITILSNIILIPKFGIIGAAYASLFSTLIFNLIKIIFINYKLKLNPFNRNTFLAIFIFLIINVLSSYLPDIQNIFLDITYKSIFITIMFVIPIYYFKISKDFNKFLQKILQKF